MRQTRVWIYRDLHSRALRPDWRTSCEYGVAGRQGAPAYSKQFIEIALDCNGPAGEILSLLNSRDTSFLSACSSSLSLLELNIASPRVLTFSVGIGEDGFLVDWFEALTEHPDR